MSEAKSTQQPANNDNEVLAAWIDVNLQKPECNEKFSESEDVLCYTKSGCFFVGWYNAKLEQWFVSHYLAESVGLSYSNVPSFWSKLPSPPSCS